MLDVVSHLLVLSLVQVSDVVVEFLDILPLQVGVTFLLIILYNFYMKNKSREIVSFQTECCVL